MEGDDHIAQVTTIDYIPTIQTDGIIDVEVDEKRNAINWTNRDWPRLGLILLKV